MKLVLRAVALCLVFAGLAAFSTSSSAAKALPSHQSATESNPIPLCAPGLPGCPDTPGTR